MRKYSSRYKKSEDERSVSSSAFLDSQRFDVQKNEDRTNLPSNPLKMPEKEWNVNPPETLNSPTRENPGQAYWSNRLTNPSIQSTSMEVLQRTDDPSELDRAKVLREIATEHHNIINSTSLIDGQRQQRIEEWKQKSISRLQEFGTESFSTAIFGQYEQILDLSGCSETADNLCSYIVGSEVLDTAPETIYGRQANNNRIKDKFEEFAEPEKKMNPKNLLKYVETKQDNYLFRCSIKDPSHHFTILKINSSYDFYESDYNNSLEIINVFGDNPGETRANLSLIELNQHLVKMYERINTTYVKDGEFNIGSAPTVHFVPRPISTENPGARTQSKCYITTACVTVKNLPDDCEELTVLREFRDRYILQKENGERLVEIYYTHSPEIVRQIDAEKNPLEIYQELYAIIRHCVYLIKREEYELAFQLYVSMVLKLKDEYLSSAKINLENLGSCLQTG